MLYFADHDLDLRQRALGERRDTPGGGDHRLQDIDIRHRRTRIRRISWSLGSTLFFMATDATHPLRMWKAS